MKKVLFLLICFSFGLNILNAECNYKELKNLNTLASYVETTYRYNEDSKNFTLVINNVPSTLLVVINLQTYMPENNVVTIPGINFGDNIKIYVNSSSEASCVNEYLRVINMMFPYLNPYYKDVKCVGHENLEVCSNRFLNYKISSNTFNKLIEDDFKNSVNKVKDDEEVLEKLSIWEIIWKYFKIIGIPVLLILGTSIITMSICSVIYRKVKHGL